MFPHNAQRLAWCSAGQCYAVADSCPAGVEVEGLCEPQPLTALSCRNQDARDTAPQTASGSAITVTHRRTALAAARVKSEICHLSDAGGTHESRRAQTRVGTRRR